MVRSHSTLYDDAWFVLYNADVRMRSEQFERLRWKSERDHATAGTAGGASDYDPAKPWGTVFAMAVANEEWWNENLQRLAMLYLTRIKSAPTAVEDGTAQPASSGSLVLEDRRPEAQERSTGKEAHTARIPGHHLSRTWSSRLGLCSLSGQAGRGSRPVRLTACHPGTRGFIVGPCSRVRLHHSPSDLHRRSPPVAPTPHTALWYQLSPMVLLWLLIAEGANGRRS